MLLLAASTLLLSGSFRANAQRTMRGQYHASAEVVMTADKGVPIGGELSFGQYLLCSYWNAWINVSPDYIPLDSTVKGKVDFPQIGFEKGTTERGVSKVSKSC